MNCPKCIGKLEEKTYRMGDAELKIDTCWSCSGLWFDKGELHRALRAPISQRALPGADPRNMEYSPGEAHCPRCGVEMYQRRAVRDVRVTEDVCPNCHGIWLDGGELEMLMRGGPLSRLVGRVSELLTDSVERRRGPMPPPRAF